MLGKRDLKDKLFPMPKFFPILLFFAMTACAQEGDEWEAYRRTGLFTGASPLWVAPEMGTETVSEFSSRLLEGSRRADASAMATLGRLFFVRSDRARAIEWLEKAASAGHAGAQFDLGSVLSQGLGQTQDLVEAYKWLWLATSGGAPGADAALRGISQKLSGAQILEGVQRAAQFHEGRPAGRAR